MDLEGGIVKDTSYYRVLLCNFNTVAKFVKVRDQALRMFKGQIDRDWCSERGTVFATHSRISKKMMQKLSIEEAEEVLITESY